MDYGAIIAVALERAAYGQPDEDGMPSEETRADIEAILGLMGEQEEGGQEQQEQKPEPAAETPAAPATYTVDAELALYESHHAPAGGVNLNGRQYVGGEFIPAEEVAKATEEERGKLDVKRSLPEKIKHAPRAIAAALKPEAIEAAADAVLEGAKHPVKTAGKALAAGKAKLKGVYDEYGPVGATAIAGAYVAYHALALANPALYPIFGSGVATIQTCAALAKRGVKKLKGEKAVYQREEEPDALATIQQALAALKTKQAEQTRLAAEAIRYAAQQREQEQAALLEAVREDDEQRLAYRKQLDDRQALIEAIRDALKPDMEAMRPAPAPPEVVKQKPDRWDAEGRITRIHRTHSDGSVSYRTVKRNAQGRAVEITDGANP